MVFIKLDFFHFYKKEKEKEKKEKNLNLYIYSYSGWIYFIKMQVNYSFLFFSFLKQNYPVFVFFSVRKKKMIW